MLSMPCSLGALSPDQITHANRMVEQLEGRLRSAYTIIRQSEAAGMSATLAQELLSTQTELMVRLGAIAEAVPSMPGAAFDEWVTRATGVRSSIERLERRIEEVAPSAAARRRGVIVTATVGSIVLAGIVAGAIYLWRRR